MQNKSKRRFRILKNAIEVNFQTPNPSAQNQKKDVIPIEAFERSKDH